MEQDNNRTKIYIYIAIALNIQHIHVRKERSHAIFWFHKDVLVRESGCPALLGHFTIHDSTGNSSRPNVWSAVTSTVAVRSIFVRWVVPVSVDLGV